VLREDESGELCNIGMYKVHTAQEANFTLGAYSVGDSKPLIRSWLFGDCWEYTKNDWITVIVMGVLWKVAMLSGLLLTVIFPCYESRKPSEGVSELTKTGDDHVPLNNSV